MISQASSRKIAHELFETAINIRAKSMIADLDVKAATVARPGPVIYLLCEHPPDPVMYSPDCGIPIMRGARSQAGFRVRVFGWSPFILDRNRTSSALCSIQTRPLLAVSRSNRTIIFITQ